MLKNLLTIVRQRGFSLIIIGFAVCAVFIIMYMFCIYRHAGIGLRLFSFYATFVGIGIFAIGRTGVFLENRDKRNNITRQDNTSKDIV
jgi:hypothetical protein